jgi:hypothetical protein
MGRTSTHFLLVLNLALNQLLKQAPSSPQLSSENSLVDSLADSGNELAKPMLVSWNW